MKEIVRLGFELAAFVEMFVGHARAYCYEVMLSGHTCPRCGGLLRMTAESSCQCTACDTLLDPTVTFQRCPACNGRLRLNICRYQCRSCGADVRSRFIFDGRVFDAAYFRERMAQVRQRHSERRELVRAAMIDNRSAALAPVATGLDTVPGLIEALDGLAGVPELAAWVPLAGKGFDLNRYQAHLEAHLQAVESGFDEIPPLDDNARLDRVWRFIALIFMAHAGLVELRQDGTDITVIRRGIDRKGQGLSGEFEAADGIA